MCSQLFFKIVEKQGIFFLVIVSLGRILKIKFLNNFRNKMKLSKLNWIYLIKKKEFSKEKTERVIYKKWKN